MNVWTAFHHNPSIYYFSERTKVDQQTDINIHEAADVAKNTPTPLKLTN